MLRIFAMVMVLFVGAAQAASAPEVATPVPAEEAPMVMDSGEAAPVAPTNTQSPVVVKADARFTEGKQYKLLPAAAAQNPTAKALLDTHKGKVEVINFFSYGCPVCNRLEPEVNKWNNNKKDTQMMVLVDVPVDWNHTGWENLARAFYVAETLNVLDKMQPALFAAVHQQGKNFKDKAALQELFLTQAGVSRQDFDSAFDSFNVRRRLKQGELLRNDYGVMAIPAFVVNGKYYVDVQTAGGIPQTLDVVDYLVNKESFTKGTKEIKFDNVAPSEPAGVVVKPAETLQPSTAQ